MRKFQADADPGTGLSEAAEYAAQAAIGPVWPALPLASLNSRVAMLVSAAIVSDLLVRLIAPLAVMPFARLGSRSLPRTRGAWVIVGFSNPAVQPACCISS